MKRNYYIIIFILFALLLTGSFSDAFAQIGSQYCQVPVSVKTASIVEPNLLFVIDASGSMSWSAYDHPNGSVTYDPAITYEGYFTPDKHYTSVSGIYKEHVPTGTPCSCTCSNWRCRNSNWGGCVWKGGGCNRWGCCLAQTCTGDCNVESGNYLNFEHMTRIDLVRWAITGGTPSSCAGSHTFDTGYCDPELYNDVTGSGKVNTVCSNTLAIDDLGTVLGGCILLADDGTQVAVPWSRVNASVTSTLKTLSVKPRIGAMSFQGSGVLDDKVYIGDFLASNSNTSATYPYRNLITHINSISPNGSTPTGPAMWDALNYLDQTTELYGGFSEQSGGGDRWKNPMYVCDNGGGNCVNVPCASNFVLLMSDGQWNTPSCNIGTNTSCDPALLANYSADPIVPAYCMHKGFTNSKTNEKTSVTAVYTLGLFLGGTGEQALKNVAMYGSFEKGGGLTWPSGTSGYPDNACAMTDCGSGTGSACEPLPGGTPHNDWDKDGDGLPDTFFKATTAYEIRDRIVAAIEDILRRSFSGTAASILASNEGSGANLLQAVFYPRRLFTNEEVSWTGILKNFWYYLDPKIKDSYIREETTKDNLLVLNQDNVAVMFFDESELRAKSNLYSDSDGDGSANAFVDTVYIENMKHIWEAGEKLWSMNPGDRKIKTNCSIKSSKCESTTGLMNFTYDNGIFSDSALWSYIQASSAAESEAIVRYIRGEDTPFNPAIPGFSSTYRDRTVTIGGTTNVWKLADIANSTPKVVSWMPINRYFSLYGDQDYFDFVNESTNLLYRKRGVVFAGSNGGMLHAFKLGLFEQVEDGMTSLKARLCNDVNGDANCDAGEFSDAELGKEMWAFIPKNALPYLKYLTDPNYCHLYYVDLAPSIVDASIGCGQADYWECDKDANSWRTILIGGMRLGGACKDTTYTGSYGVNIPVANVGYSSYFALDITDTENPKLLWEFSNENIPAAELSTGGLGFSTSGPAIVKIHARSTGNIPNRDTNGKWFVVFASGPTGPIDIAAKEFKGFSDQPLKLFVLDLKSGSLVRTINTGIQNAFGGSMKGSSMDYDLDYQDDVLYFGYTNAETNPIDANTKWTNGGVIRLVTKENFSTALNPDNWDWSYVAKDIGPVTTGIAHIAGYSAPIEVGEKQDAKSGFLYFGTGREYYEGDDSLTQRHIFGIIEPCLNKLQNESNSPVCNDSALVCNNPIDGALVTAGSLQCIGNASASSAGADNDYGWYIELDAASGSQFAERNVSTPVATTLGAVYFVTFAPKSDICSFGGTTYLWQVNYSTGGSLSMDGKAVMQVSTGVVADVGFQSAFTGNEGRQGIVGKGKGSDSDIVIQQLGEPIRKIMHIGR